MLEEIPLKRLYEEASDKFKHSCPNCGAAIESDICPYCGTHFIDFACFRLGEPFWLKIKDEDGNIFIHKVFIENLTKHIAYNEPLYCDDKYISYCARPATEISMDFNVIE